MRISDMTEKEYDVFKQNFPSLPSYVKRGGTYLYLEGISNKACKAPWKLSVRLEGKKPCYAIYKA